MLIQHCWSLEKIAGFAVYLTDPAAGSMASVGLWKKECRLKPVKGQELWWRSDEGNKDAKKIHGSCWPGMLVNGLLYRTCSLQRIAGILSASPSTADKMLCSYSLIKRSCRGSMKLFAAPRGTRHLYVQLLREVEGAFRNGVGFVYTGTKAFVCKCTFLLLA